MACSTPALSRALEVAAANPFPARGLRARTEILVAGRGFCNRARKDYPDPFSNGNQPPEFLIDPRRSRFEARGHTQRGRPRVRH